MVIDVGWDDVNGGLLKVEDIKKARAEEVGYMEGRSICRIVLKRGFVETRVWQLVRRTSFFLFGGTGCTKHFV